MKKPYLLAPVENAQCPFCLHTGGRILYEVTSSDAALHFVYPWQDTARNVKLHSIIKQLWHQNSCRVVECGWCSGVFSFPFVGGDAEFYETANAEQKHGAYPCDRWEYKQSLRFLSSAEGASVLEIGAGDGAFVRRLIGAGIPASSITALEYSSYGMNAMRSRYPGVEVMHGEDLTGLPDSHFTHVFLFQVLEHLGNVDGFMDKLWRLLKTQGNAFISVPHPDRVRLHELSGLTLDMPPNHISRFSEKAMGMLAHRNDLELLDIVDEPFSWGQAFPEFLRFHFLKLAQTRGSIAARIHTQLQGRSHKIAAGLFAMTLAPHAALTLGASKKPGGNRLFILKKP